MKLRIFYQDYGLEDPTSFGISATGNRDLEGIDATVVVYLCEQIGLRGFWLRPGVFLPPSAILGVEVFHDDGSKLEENLPGMGEYLEVGGEPVRPVPMIFVCSGSCETGDCECRRFDAAPVVDGKPSPPLHEGCHCYTAPDDGAP